MGNSWKDIGYCHRLTSVRRENVTPAIQTYLKTCGTYSYILDCISKIQACPNFSKYKLYKFTKTSVLAFELFVEKCSRG